MITIEEIKDLLYERFGAFSKQALEIFRCAAKANIGSLHQLTYDTGYSFRVVREVIYTFEPYITLTPHHEMTMSNEFRDICHHIEAGMTIPTDQLDVITTIVQYYTKHNADLDHIAARPETCYRRAELLLNQVDTERCNMLFLGDHDLTSLSLALLSKALQKKYNLFVVDIDDNVLTYIEDMSKRYGLSITTAHSDFRYSIPRNYIDMMDVVFTDPPYTAEGMGVFLNRGIQCLRNNPFSMMYISYKTAEMSNALGVAVQKEISKRSLYVSELVPNFNTYYKAEALGYRSDLYICRVTPRSYKYLENPQYSYKIYTHGKDSVESQQAHIDIDAMLSSMGDVVETDGASRGSKLHLIESGDRIKYTSSRNISILSLRRFVENVMEGRSNINTLDATVFVDCTGFSESYQFRPLLLCGFDQYYCLLTHVQAQQLQQGNRIIDFLRQCYDMKKIELAPHNDDVCVYSFHRKKEWTDRTSKLFWSMLLNTRSGLRNSFVKSVTSIWGATKNEARALYDQYQLHHEKSTPMFHLSEQSLDRLTHLIGVVEEQIGMDMQEIKSG